MTGYAGLPAAVDLPSLLPSSLSPATPDGRPRRTVRDWIVDILAFLLAVTGGALLFGAQEEVRPSPEPLILLDLAVGVVAVTLLWWRRRWPVAIALALTPVGVFSATVAFAAVIMIFTVAVHRPARTATIVGGLNLLTVPPFYWIRGDHDSSIVLDIVLGLLVTALVLGWGMFARARRQLVTSLTDRAARAEQEQQFRVDQARALERTRIAREMHDVLAHRLSLLSVHAGALEFRPDADREQVTAAVRVIRANAHQALEELREVIGLLREDRAADDAPEGVPEPPQPGLAEIPALVADSTQAGVRVRYHPGEVPAGDDVPASVARTAYRVVQEGLTNARKHAPGATVDVVLTGGPQQGLVVQISNPLGVRATSVPGAGLGLVGLGERVQLAGGRLEHRTEDGRFVLRAELPGQR